MTNGDITLAGKNLLDGVEITYSKFPECQHTWEVVKDYRNKKYYKCKKCGIFREVKL